MKNDDLAWLSISDLCQKLDRGDLTAAQVVEALVDRIHAVDGAGPAIRSIIEVNPDAPEIATNVGAHEEHAAPRPLRGIPILIKDNIDTADAMLTTAGSLALAGSSPVKDAFVVQRLRRAGAVILGKANMSEWANFRSTHSSSGWSARGGQARNPYVLDRSPCGSSSGSASAVAAGLVPGALGTETDGSILCPAAMCGVVGIKPTVGLTSRGGVIPISHSQDTVGPFARTVADAALVLGVIAGIDTDDLAPLEATSRPMDYTQFLVRAGLSGARIGVARDGYFGYSPAADGVVEDGIAAMRAAGAVIIDPVDLPASKLLNDGELTVLLYEFRDGLDRYLAGRKGDGPRTLQELIDFNESHRDSEMPFFSQELFLMAQEKGPLTDIEYLDALASNTRLSRDEGIDRVINENRLDALVMPTTSPAFPIDQVNGDHYSGGASTPAALAGYPAITVPAGFVRGLPVGITFMGRAWSETVLVRLAYAFEQLTQAWRPPQFLPTLLPVDTAASGDPRPASW